MEFYPRVQDFYLDDAVSINTADNRKKIVSKVKRVGNMWMIPDGYTFEKQHKAYKALNDQPRQMEYLYIDPAQKIDYFFDLDIPKYVSNNYRLLDAEEPYQIQKRSFKSCY